MEPTPDRLPVLERANLPPRSAEVDEEAMFHAQRTEITTRPRGVFISQRPACLQFHDEAIFHERICVVPSPSRAVLVARLQRELPLEGNSGPPHTLSQPVLAHFLHMPLPQVAVQARQILLLRSRSGKTASSSIHTPPGFPKRGSLC
jgi:hypothetical protein